MNNTAGITLPITYAEIDGANKGERNDLLYKPNATYLGPDNALWSENAGQLLRQGSVSPYVLAQSGIPMVLAPNGTVATNGVITLATAVSPITVSGCWIRLPAGAVLNSPAGLYYAIFTSTTVGQVYTAMYDPATEAAPGVPRVLVPAVGSNTPYVQATSTNITLANVLVPANTLGAFGGLEIASIWSMGPAASGTRLLEQRFATQTFKTNNFATDRLSYCDMAYLTNRGVATRQISWSSGYQVSYGSINGGVGVLSVDTTKHQPLIFTGAIAVATDYAILEYFSVRVLPA